MNRMYLCFKSAGMLNRTVKMDEIVRSRFVCFFYLHILEFKFI